MWQLLGPQAVCVTENSWRPSLAAGERPSGPYPGSVHRSQWLSPRAGAEQYRQLKTGETITPKEITEHSTISRLSPTKQKRKKKKQKFYWNVPL